MAFKSDEPEKQKPLQVSLQGFCESGGEEEIRTLDTVSRIHTFQACSFNHSDTSPDLERFGVYPVEAR
jgi:hypothetical protein